MSTFCRRSCEFQSTLPLGSDRERTQRHAAHGISIHAPSRERQGLLQLLAIGAGISIHAPFRERRVLENQFHYLPEFQSTLPCGSDASFSFFFCRYSAFQSTLPHGSDQLFSLNRLVLAYFTPRSLAGATLPSVSFVLADLISIHAPSRERPNCTKAASCDAAISIHAPSRERLHWGRGFAGFYSFQSTIPHRSDLSIHYILLPIAISIHAPSRERP